MLESRLALPGRRGACPNGRSPSPATSSRRPPTTLRSPPSRSREHGDRRRARDAADDPVWAVETGSALYIEVFRGLPILVTVFIVFFGLPASRPQLEFGPVTATTIALVLWGSAQVAEATRGAVVSIPREQHEAAAALGFGWVGRHAFVIVPQALRRLLPPLVSLLVNIIQNSTLAAVIGGSDLLQVGEAQTERLDVLPAGRYRRDPCRGDLRLRDGRSSS